MTNSPKSEAREFILVKEKLSNAALAFDLGSFIPQNWPPSSYVDTLYVIEHSAYDKLMQQAQKMREALLKHGCHSMECPCLSDTIDGQYNIPCTCGFSEALEQFDEFMSGVK